MNQLLWTFGRLSGFVSLLLLTLSLLLGVLSGSGRSVIGLPRFVIALLHRNISLLSTAFLILHIGTLVLACNGAISLLDLFVPFLSRMNAWWWGLGTLATDFLIAIALSALLRHRIGQRTFKAIHWLSYAMWPIAVVHAIGSGTDGKNYWVLSTTMLSIALVSGALFWRLSPVFVENYRARSGGIE